MRGEPWPLDSRKVEGLRRVGRFGHMGACYVMSCRGQVLPRDAIVLAVFEDWKGDGAGNGKCSPHASQKLKPPA